MLVCCLYICAEVSVLIFCSLKIYWISYCEFCFYGWKKSFLSLIIWTYFLLVPAFLFLLFYNDKFKIFWSSTACPFFSLIDCIFNDICKPFLSTLWWSSYSVTPRPAPCRFSLLYCSQSCSPVWGDTLSLWSWFCTFFKSAGSVWFFWAVLSCCCVCVFTCCSW